MTRTALAAISIALATQALAACRDNPAADLVCSSISEPASEDGSEPFAQGYFPPSFSRPTMACGTSCISVIGEIESDWYPEHLRAAGEGSFYALSKQSIAESDYSLRFTWLRTFDPPVIIRVDHRDGEATLVAKELTGLGGYEPGEVGRTKTIILPRDLERELQALLDQDRLFDEPPATCEYGLDGSQWIFERADSDGYELVKRWTPREGNARRLGMHLIGLTGWTFDEVY
jgi:hypothetical protein